MESCTYEQRRSEEVRSNVVQVYLLVFCELPDERVIIFAAIYIHPASAAPAVKPYQKPGFFVVTLVRRTSESMKDALRAFLWFKSCSVGSRRSWTRLTGNP
jgi:hypothetical protein